jgi:putative cardiolipin synthase
MGSLPDGFHIWALAGAVALVAGLALVSIYAFGSAGQRRQGEPSYALPVKPAETPLDATIAPLTGAHPGDSGLLLLVSNLAAFRARMETAQAAGRSLDLQYYYWKNDLTGRLLIREVIAAAQRGVRVRLLLDDINSFGFDPSLLALDSHANISVRLFNPSRSRTNAFRRGLELAARYFTATRRMHNKCWIADGRVLIAGGRNIGDAYFDASREANFRDADLLAVGDCVAEAAAVFDLYWNSAAALPIRTLHKIRRIRRPRLSRLMRRLDENSAGPTGRLFLDAVSKAPALGSLHRLHWSRGVTVMADPPEKAAGKARQQWMGEEISALLATTRHALLISSPYFIPGAAVTRTLTMLANGGRQVRVLTNSLAATDVLAVHGAYARYRKALVAAGVALHELKPEPRRRRASLFGSRTASLHTKAFLIDDDLGFVGSFNLDPRSHSINTEMGLLFRCPHIVKQLRAVFETEMDPEASYQVMQQGGRLVWRETVDGKVLEHDGEPLAPWRRRIPAKIIAWLPIESQL